jgi:hypothetical protein
MKTALITGAGKRIGAYLARDLASSGYRVALHYHHSRQEALETARVIEAAGGVCAPMAADLADTAACAALVDAVFDRFGALDLLVNNAALFSYDTLQTAEPAAWTQHLAVNLTAPVFLMQALARRLPADGRAIVINMLDQKYHWPNPDYFSYTAGKVALAYLTPALALALAPRIRVCGIAPGVTLPSGPQSEEDFERAAAATPSGVTSSLADLARALHFAIDTPAFSGQILTVDGGEALLGRQRDVAFDESV